MLFRSIGPTGPIPTKNHQSQQLTIPSNDIFSLQVIRGKSKAAPKKAATSSASRPRLGHWSLLRQSDVTSKTVGSPAKTVGSVAVFKPPRRSKLGNLVNSGNFVGFGVELPSYVVILNHKLSIITVMILYICQLVASEAINTGYDL